MLIFLLVFVVLALFCAFKESKTTGLYKSYGVYGRLKAYLALDLALVGVLGTVGGIILPFLSGDAKELVDQGMPPLAMIAMGLVCLAIGVAIYYLTYRKCPEPLKKKCVISMIISGMGVACKIAVFFLPFVWALSVPGGGASVPVAAPAGDGDKVEVYSVDSKGYRTDYKVNSTGDMYFKDGEWHKIKK